MSTPVRGETRRQSNATFSRRTAGAPVRPGTGSYSPAARQHRSPTATGSDALRPSPRRAAEASLGYSRSKGAPAAHGGYSRAGPSQGLLPPGEQATSPMEGPSDRRTVSRMASAALTDSSTSSRSQGKTPPPTRNMPADGPPPADAPLVSSSAALRQEDALCRMTDTVSHIPSPALCYAIRMGASSPASA